MAAGSGCRSLSAARLFVCALGVAVLALAAQLGPALGQADRPLTAPEPKRAKKPNAQVEKGEEPPPRGPADVAEAMPPVDDLEQCISASDLEDRDNDVRRNRVALSARGLCIKQHVFQEGGLRWVLQIVQSKVDPNAFFWMVPHDNEQSAFDTAVYGVSKYHGTVVAVETGGQRNNGKQDPNRNFDAKTGLKCADQVAHSRLYTTNVMRWRRNNAPIIALHTNSGKGKISITKPYKGPKPFPAANPIASKSPDNTLIFVASTELPEDDPNMMRFVKALNGSGIHVLYETVSRERNDCSLSNYAALTGIRDYINIEVVEGDGDAQRDMLDRVHDLVRNGVGPIKKKASQKRPVLPRT